MAKHALGVTFAVIAAAARYRADMSRVDPGHVSEHRAQALWSAATSFCSLMVFVSVI